MSDSVLSMMRPKKIKNTFIYSRTRGKVQLVCTQCVNTQAYEVSTNNGRRRRRRRRRRQGESESESGLESGLGLYPCGLGLGLGLHLCGLGLKRCGLGLWSYGLGLGLGLGLHPGGLGLTVSPGESGEKCKGKFKFLMCNNGRNKGKQLIELLN